MEAVDALGGAGVAGSVGTAVGLPRVLAVGAGTSSGRAVLSPAVRSRTISSTARTVRPSTTMALASVSW